MIPFKLLFNKSTRIHSMDEDDLTMNEVLQTIYPIGEESSITMIWNNCFIELHLSAQIADVYSDIIKMLNYLLITKDNEFDIFWGSNSFMAQWHFKREKNSLTIEAVWTSISGGKETLNNLNKVSNTVNILVSPFVDQWISLIYCIKNDVLRAGYNTDFLEDFEDTAIILDVYSN